MDELGWESELERTDKSKNSTILKSSSGNCSKASECQKNSHLVLNTFIEWKIAQFKTSATIAIETHDAI